MNSYVSFVFIKFFSKWGFDFKLEVDVLVIEYERIFIGSSVSDCVYFYAEVDGLRQFGDLVISLGNGFMNFMLMLYAGKCCGCDMWGFVTGDDGLFVVMFCCGVVLSCEFFSKWGFDFKLEVVGDVFDVSFCGNVYVLGEYYNFMDFLNFLGKVPWYNGSDCM